MERVNYLLLRLVGVLLALTFDHVTGCLLCHGRALLPAPSGALRNFVVYEAPHTSPLVEGEDRIDVQALQPLFATRRIFAVTNQRITLRNNFHSEEEEKESNEEESEQNKVNEKESGDDGMSAAMIASIGFYKKVISPLLPPACRFVPTCSSYGVQAIKEFGPTKGGILIAWRLLRCSPIGGKGYDPPKWPPVPYTYSSY